MITIAMSYLLLHNSPVFGAYPCQTRTAFERLLRASQVRGSMMLAGPVRSNDLTQRLPAITKCTISMPRHQKQYHRPPAPAATKTTAIFTLEHKTPPERQELLQKRQPPGYGNGVTTTGLSKSNTGSTKDSRSKHHVRAIGRK